MTVDGCVGIMFSLYTSRIVIVWFALLLKLFPVTVIKLPGWPEELLSDMLGPISEENMSSGKLRNLVILPEAPSMLMEYIPGLTQPATVTVIVVFVSPLAAGVTDDELKLQVTPGGASAEKVTSLLKELSDWIIMSISVLLFASMDKKSGERLT